MTIPSFRVSKKRFFIQYLTVFNLFKFRLSPNAIILLAEILYTYSEYRNNNLGVSHKLICGKILSPEVENLIREELKWNLNVFARYMNELNKKKVIDGGLIKEYICINPMKDNLMELRWEVI